MPFDKLKAKKDLSGINAFARMPAAEYIQRLGNHLGEAITLIESTEHMVAKEQAKVTVAETQLMTERQAFAVVREKIKQLDEAVAVLKDIASSQKGGKGKALAGLKALGVELAPAAPSSEEVEA